MSRAGQRTHFPKTSKSGRRRILDGTPILSLVPSYLRWEYICVNISFKYLLYIIMIHLFAVCTLMDVVCTFHCVYHGNVLVFRFGKETCGFLQVILKRPSEQWKTQVVYNIGDYTTPAVFFSWLICETWKNPFCLLKAQPFAALMSEAWNSCCHGDCQPTPLSP